MFFLQNGYRVLAFDASAEVATIASKHIGQPVAVQRIEDMRYNQEFDGVWAMASLLHLPKHQMPLAIKNCIQALAPAGQLFISLKAGEGSSVDEKGRYFSYYSAPELSALCSQQEGIDKLEIQEVKDTLGRAVTWLQLYISKNPSLVLQEEGCFINTASSLSRKKALR